ncbi:MAG: biopolymer transporter ExbD [Pseudomonadota bacterium]
MSIRDRRRKKDAPELEITAFLNLMVALVPFLLITAVFTQVSVLDLHMPPAADPSLAQQQDQAKLDLEVVVRARVIDVADSNGVIKSFAKQGNGQFDYAAINMLLRELKKRFPEKTDAMILAEPDTSYDTLVQVMDTVRLYETTEGTTLVQHELFPDMAIGDAPITAAGM